MSYAEAQAKRKRAERGFTCTDCDTYSTYGEVHTWLFCLLHKQGWTRRQIVDEIRRNASLLEEDG